jgi:hypothetical protein
MPNWFEGMEEMMKLQMKPEEVEEMKKGLKWFKKPEELEKLVADGEREHARYEEARKRITGKYYQFYLEV